MLSELSMVTTKKNEREQQYSRFPWLYTQLEVVLGRFYSFWHIDRIFLKKKTLNHSFWRDTFAVFWKKAPYIRTNRRTADIVRSAGDPN